ncbi:lytic transglycosylase domain-containing protein [Anaeroselena agilis]|uniref:Lytic transglycosylase domain-containing protein n=1 Tax=Anaeroselena agilis TaxID=3063788 RepID=A0ABU3NYE8_9FIRM|nr:lytic transglycosylase domain-containing protein [Selenomonadales bacterium 4137-cl]
MESMQRVMQRIAAIEQRFQHLTPAKPVRTDGFAAAMTKAQSSGGPVRTTAAGRQEIAAMVQAAARRHGVDANLALAVATAESDLQPQAVSSAGAKGVMQLMPDTAQALGVGNTFDPRENIDGGVRYLKQMLAAFDGDVVKAVAAYNAGPDAVRQHAGVPPFPETRAYVNRVLSLCG